MSERAENKLAEGLGIDRGILRKLRGERFEEDDFVYGENGRIEYTDSGMAKLQAFLGEDAAPEDAGQRAPERGLVCVKIRRVLRGGIRLLCVYEGREVVVAVRDNSGYRVSQEITVERVEGRSLWYARETGRRRR